MVGDDEAFEAGERGEGGDRGEETGVGVERVGDVFRFAHQDERGREAPDFARAGEGAL